MEFMEEFVKTSDVSYRDFSNHSDDEQVQLLAKSGKFYEAFWNFHVLVYDGHIVEDEALLVGILCVFFQESFPQRMKTHFYNFLWD